MQRTLLAPSVFKSITNNSTGDKIYTGDKQVQESLRVKVDMNLNSYIHTLEHSQLLLQTPVLKGLDTEDVRNSSANQQAVMD